MKRGCIVVLLVLATISFVSADVITPGYHMVGINNTITNIADFPNYDFFSMGDITPSMCPLKLIGTDGKIDNYYKFCGVFVYAIPKGSLTASKIEEINTEEANGGSWTVGQATAYLDSLSGKKVLGNIATSMQLPDTSPITSEVMTYSIDPNQLKTTPDNKVVVRNNLIYLYIFLPIVAAAAVAVILILRNKAKKAGKINKK